MEHIVFWVTLAAEAAATVCVLVSIAFPQRRIWPPPRQHAWQSYLMWSLFLASAAGVIALGFIGSGQLALPPWVRFGIGLPLVCAGNALSVWAMAVLGIAPSFGSESELVCRGPYRFSRNPQYVGFIVGLIGWALLSSNQSTLVASLAGVVPLIVVPFAEEGWLLERHGAAYEEYKRNVPRYVSLRRRSGFDA